MILSSLVCRLLAPWTAASPIPSRFFSPLPPWATETARQIESLLHVVSWPHGQQSHPHTIKEPLSSMDSREERVIQNERALTWIWFCCHKDYGNQIEWSPGNHTWHGVNTTQAHKLHYFETHSFYLGSFRKTLNNLTFTKFVRFSTSFLSWDFYQFPK